MKQILLLLALVSLMSCAMIPEVQVRETKKFKKRSELIRECVFQLSDSHGLREATLACLKIYSRKEIKLD